MSENVLSNGKLRGNRCGHCRTAPKMTLFKPFEDGKKKRPLLLSLSAKRSDEFFYRPSLFPSLNFANGSTRQMRSERREACNLTMKCLLKFTDIRTLCVGIPQRDPLTGETIFAPITANVLAKHIGIPVRRVMRALADLVRGGLITSSQPRMRDDQENYIGLPAIRAVSKDFFGALGLTKMLEKERNKRRHGRAEKSALRHQYEAENPTAKARGRLMLKALMAQVKKKTRFNAPDPYLSVPEPLTYEPRPPGRAEPKPFMSKAFHC